MKFSIAFLVCVVVALTGCSGKVKAVKNAPSLTQNYTIGQILDNNPMCQSTEWKTLSDANGRELVEYSCSVKLDPAALQARHAAVISNIEETRDRELNNYAYARTNLEKSLKEDGQIDFEIKQLAEELKNLNVKLAAHQSGDKNPSELDLRIAIAGRTKLVNELQSRLDSENSKNLLVYKQVVAFEATFKSRLEKDLAVDRKSLEDFYKHAYKLEQKIQFLVNGENVARVAYGFYLDDKQLPIAGELGEVLEHPNGGKALTKFWIDVLPFPKLLIEKFPYFCSVKEGCIEVK